jgi:DNA repair protein RecO
VESFEDHAIVLRVVPFQERHRIIAALTEHHGKVSVMAKNSISSRRFGGALDPFTAGHWRWTRKANAEMGFLQEAIAKRSFEGLRADFEHLALASVFNELVLKTAPEGEPCPELFKLHANALAALEEPPAASGRERTLLNAYLAKLLQWSGSQPRLQECLSCAKPLGELNARDVLTCAISDAGWFCPECRSAGGFERSFAQAQLRVSAGAVRDFFVSLAHPIRQAVTSGLASEDEHLALFTFLEALLIYHVPGFDRQPLKGLRFLVSGSNPPRALSPPR